MHENRRLKVRISSQFRSRIQKGISGTACTMFAFENRPYLGEFEAEFKKDLARESGAQGVLFDEKPKVENLVTLSL
jgi:hypothetical protein